MSKKKKARAKDGINRNNFKGKKGCAYMDTIIDRLMDEKVMGV